MTTVKTALMYLTGKHRSLDMMFSFDSPNKGSKNHVDIPAGESADIQLAFLISEDMVGNVYVNIVGDDWTNSGDPIVDLCNVK